MNEVIIDTETLENLLRGRGYGSLSEFASHAGIHRNTVRKYIVGNAPIFSRGLAAISSQLGVQPWQLLKQLHDKPYEELVAKIKAIANHDKQLAFVLFGSRAKKTAKKYSDWDIGVSGGSTPVESNHYLALRQEVDDAFDDFPFGVQLVNLDQAPTWFLQELNTTVQFLCGNIETFNYFIGVIHGIAKTSQAK